MKRRLNIAVMLHYFPPINSSGAKRFEAMTKYFAREGHNVTVFTTSKSGADGEFSEAIPEGVELYELDGFGRIKPSLQGKVLFEDMYAGKPSFKRKLKRRVMNWFGQLPDPRLPFALAFAGPFLALEVRSRLRDADVVIGSCPPWPLILASLIVSRRFGALCIMDYRDPFSDCHEMPGGRFATFVERIVDRFLVRRADCVVAISNPIGDYYRQFNPRTSVIMNGYDHEMVERAAAAGGWIVKTKEQQIILRYMGLVSPGRVPHNLLRALTKAAAARPELLHRLRFEYYGPGDVMRGTVAREYPSLTSLFHFFSNVPYVKSLQLSIEADYLLFCETSSKHNLSAQGILTTKLFEYIASGRHIIAEIGVQTLAGSLIVKADKRHFVSTDAAAFEQLFLSDGFLSPGPSEQSPIAPRLSRKYAADQYMDLMQELVTSRL
jgi:Glycosyl transferase 4-like domain